MKKLTATILVFCMMLISCDVSSLSELNENEKEPADVPADPLFTSAQVTLGTFIHNSNVNINIFKLLAQHWTTTTYTAEPRYEVDSRTIPGNVWTILYRDVLIDLQAAAEKIRANEALDEGVRANQLASVEVLEVMTYYILVTLYGGVPYTEALNSENPQPSYDDAETIYMSIMDSLDTAIASFDTSAAGFGNADIFYSTAADPIASWVRFANSVKLRLAITVIDAPGFEARAQAAIEEAAPNAISSNAQNALIPFTAAPPNTNPVWEELVESGRDDYLPAAPLVSRMDSLNDPRMDVWFTQLNGEYVGGVYGAVNEYTDYSHFSALFEEPDRPGVIFGYDEVEFILAEAAARGLAVTGTPAEHYNAAITADMEYWGVPGSEITAYLSQPTVAYTGANPLQQIGLQKWIGLFGQGYQAWTVHRRLNVPNLQAPDDAAVDEVPSRYTYPIDEVNFNNANYQEALSTLGGPDELTTPLFWDVELPTL